MQYAGTIGVTSDPCADGTDCASASGYECNVTSGWCQKLPQLPQYCRTDTFELPCAVGAFCNGTMAEPPGISFCSPVISEGQACSWDESGANSSAYRLNPCEDGSICHQAGGMLGVAPVGMCTPLNSLPPGATFPVSSLGAVEDGYMLCASGLAIPTPGAASFPSNTAMCVAALDWSMAGTSCSTCNQSVDRAYPLASNGHLQCVPAAAESTHACVLVPLTQYPLEYGRTRMLLNACARRSTQMPLPGRPACTAFSRSWRAIGMQIRSLPGTCVYYACYSAWAALQAATVAVNSFWMLSRAGATLPLATPCVASTVTDLVALAMQGTSGCSLPPAWASTPAAWRPDGPPAIPPLPTPPAQLSVPVLVSIAVCGAVALAVVAGAIVLLLRRRAAAREQLSPGAVEVVTWNMATRHS